jgi:hypothetical protein
MPEEKPKIDVDIAKEAIDIVKNERDSWDEATCFVTDKVAFKMRNLIRQIRRNYWGIFEEPNDPNTGRKKIWMPLTEVMVENVVKNIDLDTKDINIGTDDPELVGNAFLIRSAIKNALDSFSDQETSFGEEIDMLSRNLAIDGTAVWKTMEVKSGGKYGVQVRPVDLLNIYVDPTTPSLQSAYRVTERAIMLGDELKAMDGWMNTDVDTYYVNRNDYVYSSTVDKGIKGRDVWEMWGKIPKYLITGNKKNTEEIDGHIVCSGLEQSGEETIHLIEENTKEQKPYEEAWYSRIQGRWYGRGIAERLLMIQLYLNIIVNIRINRSYVSQLGLFKIKKGAGVTPQMLTRLPVNGAVVLDRMEDLEQLVMQEASQASYNDETNIFNWAERLTSAFEVATGERLPSSTPATSAVLQERASQSMFVMIKEQIGMFLDRWLSRHYIPTILKNLKKGDIIKIINDPDILQEINEKVANYLVHEKLAETIEQRQFVNPLEVMAERDRVLARLNTQAEQYVKLIDKLDFSDYKVKTDITNEKIDKGVLIQNLISTLQLAPEYRDIVLRELFDKMGLNAYAFYTKGKTIPPMGNMPLQQENMPMAQTPSQNPVMPAMTAANAGV